MYETEEWDNTTELVGKYPELDESVSIQVHLCSDIF